MVGFGLQSLKAYQHQRAGVLFKKKKKLMHCRI